MTRNRALLLGFVLLVGAIVVSGWAYPLLPLRVATHWNLAGEANGYSSRLVAVSLMPVMISFVWLLMLVLPAISPRGFRLEASAAPFYTSLLAVIAMMLAVHFGILHAQVTGAAPSHAHFLIPIGLLFVVLGTVMGRLKRNFWIGVRTPWTLASDEVWARTNQLAGTLFVLGGIGTVAASLVGGARAPVLLIVVGIVAIVPIAYSYVLYRRIEGFGENDL
ncbi:MAG TPA: SdpI family protein [Candidatus Cybelea sp.]|jgi:uncharacterized membrane protein|nr:SdpI family protein [Candidatus Cybelea sp.]